MSTLLLLLALVQVDEPYQRFAAAYATLDPDRVIQLDESTTNNSGWK